MKHCLLGLIYYLIHQRKSAENAGTVMRHLNPSSKLSAEASCILAARKL